MATTPVVATTPTAVEAAELSIEMLGGLTYRGILDQPVTLSGGLFEGEPFVEGGASRPTVSLMAAPVAYGDLDGDGRADAAALLVSDSGGSGDFVYLAVVEWRDGQPVNTASALLGDRVQVKSLAVADGLIQAELLSHGPDDPACCPTLETTRKFRWQGDQLVAADD